MKANIDKTFKIERPINEVWDFLSDPQKIVTCVPGAQLTETIDEKNYKGTVSMKIGPVVSSFNGQITMEKVDQTTHTMEILGKGVDTKGKGSANMVLAGKLVDNGDNTTEVTNNMEVSITGKLAQFGSRMIVDVSDQVFKQFVANFRGQLQAAAEPTDGAPPPPAEAKPIKALPLFFSMIWNAILRLFGKKPRE
ncbi:MAG: SRPBCC family protein [Cyclobacteriaceae bacterium]|nr:SRPBCC family protein [Cyclobacteriaceae bacterium]